MNIREKIHGKLKRGIHPVACWWFHKERIMDGGESIKQLVTY